MRKQVLTELVVSMAVLGTALLTLIGLESLPEYLMQYLLRSGLIYQGY
jgi:hypothetical protein